MRIGFGYDLHKLAKGRKLILGGILVPSEKGLLGHSDADVLLHAIIDALLGAAGLGDIGEFFPDTDKKYKDISSSILLDKAAKLIKGAKYYINNIDAVIVLEKPKLSKFKKLSVTRQHPCGINNFMQLPNPKDAKHKAWLYRILSAFYDDPYLASVLYFKGGISLNLIT